MKIMLIEWLDSFGCTPSWSDLTEFKPVLPTMKSIGWVVYEDENLISICGNIADETNDTVFQGNGIMTIPKIAIMSTKEVSI